MKKKTTVLMVQNGYKSSGINLQKSLLIYFSVHWVDSYLP